MILQSTARQLVNLPVAIFFAAVQLAPDLVELPGRSPVQPLAFRGAVHALLAAPTLLDAEDLLQTIGASLFEGD
jgi:hypothetical protein